VNRCVNFIRASAPADKLAALTTLLNACVAELDEFWGTAKIVNNAFAFGFASVERPPFDHLAAAHAAGVKVVCHYYSDDEHTMGVYDDGTHTPITPPTTAPEFGALPPVIRTLMPYEGWIEYADSFGYDAMSPWKLAPCEEATHAFVSFLLDELDPCIYEDLEIDPDSSSSDWTLDEYNAVCDYLGLPTHDQAFSLPMRVRGCADESVVTNAISDTFCWLITEIMFVKEAK
jgi:hypothetical protein